MTIPTDPKTQDTTEEEQYELQNNSIFPDSEDESSQPSPSQPITPPIFNFRTNFKNIYISPITNPSTILPNRDDNNELELSPPQPKWDEFCIQWCKQKDLNRDKSIIPECKMLCFRKFNNRFKNDLLKKIVVEEKLNNNNNKHEVKNVAQVLYNKDKNVEEVKIPRNFLDGYYLYYVKGLEVCQKHTEGMKDNEILNRSTWIQNNPEEYEIDLGEKFEKTKSETTRIVKRAFTPGYLFAKRYLESWSDGTQSSFFKRFYESVQRMDAVHIMQDNVKKAIEVWVDGGDNNGGGPNINNGNVNVNGNEGNDKNFSDERNEKD
ncbi:hypothetical protein C1645_815222 [Glomus cerebriforme]|uniref:Uncharacterized protein n=1 Tax=Glomus cerebriforme TaxID=658196 RepID=A0A397TEI4_9GLOM|nr:hypothetical protein C1645_815222 [Glomus cerebriforme]